MAKTVRGLVREITGKQVVVADFPEYYFIGSFHMEIPGGRGKKEQTIHEVMHWVVAEDWQRDHPLNLGYGHSMDDYDGKDPRCTARFMERQELMCCHLQRLLYQLANKPWPKYGSCNFEGRKRALTDEEVTWLMGRAAEAGWPQLVALARSRW